MSAADPNSEIEALPRPCMAKAKSARPSRNAKISRARHKVRTSRRGCIPPASAGTTALRKPALPSALTRARHAASTSSCGSDGKVASAQLVSAAAKRRCAWSKNGQLSVSSRLMSVALEHRLLLGGKDAERAHEILCLHAQRLLHRLGLDRGLDRHRPLHFQHALGHGIGKGRAIGELGGPLPRVCQHLLGRCQPVEKSPALCLLPAEHAAGEQQFRGAALADDARQDRAGAHVAAGQPDAVEEKRHLGRRRSNAQIAGHREDSTGARAHPLDGGDDRLRAGAHRLDHLAGHAGELQELFHLHLGERLDDLEHVAAGTEIPARSGDDECLYLIVLCRRAKQLAELGVAVEGERILLFRTIERDGCELALDREPKVARGIARKRRRDRAVHRLAPLPIALRADAFVLASSRSSVSISPAERSENISPIQSPLARAMARKKRRPCAVRLTSWARRSLGAGRRATRPCSTSRSTSPVTLPFDTIMRWESSPSVIPFGVRSSCAIRSKRGKVTPKLSRSRRRTSLSIPSLQANR